MLYEQDISAGVPWQMNVPGKYFLLDSTGDHPTVTVTLLRDGSPIFGQIPGAKRGLKIGVDAGFDGVRVEADVDTTVRFFAAFENVSISTTDGASVDIKNDAAHPVPVDVQGAVLSVSDVTVSNADAAAIPIRKKALSTHVHVAPVEVGVAETAAVSDATLRRVVFRNAHDTAVIALGGVGVTLANAAIRLLPGGTYIDDEAAGSVWKAISDTNGAVLQIQGAK